jgi:hypothetical protein
MFLTQEGAEIRAFQLGQNRYGNNQLAASTAAVSLPPTSQASRMMHAKPTTALAVRPQQDF